MGDKEFPEVMTVAEAAAYLRTSVKSVRDWLREGKLPGVKLGTFWRLRKSELDKLLAQRSGEKGDS